jgi:hypothetical protein
MLARIGLAAATFAALAVLPALVPTSAAASTVSYQLTLTESAPTMTFGGATPSFRAYLTPPADDPPLKFGAFYLTVDSIDSTRYEGSISGTSPYMLYETGINPPVVGQHTVVANYQSPNHGLLTSAPVTLTVLKTTAPIGCVNYKVENTYVPNTPFTIEVVPGYTNAPAEVKNGTFTLTFSGARTFTTANLTANSAGQISASLPPAYGIYQAKCGFSSSASYNPTEAPMNVPTVIVSARNAVGGIAVYTNPTPVTHGPMITWEVVVSARSGLPTPTGYVGLTIDGAYTKLVALGAEGSVTFQAFAPAFRPSASIRVDYMGDPTYVDSFVDLPMSTPPIPGTGSPSAGTGSATAGTGSATAGIAQPNSTPSSTPTPVTTESPTAPPVSMAMSSPSHPASVALMTSTGQSKSSGKSAFYLVGALALLTLIGLGSGLAWRRRRRA